MRYDFYAYMDRMKYIKRWQLMRSMRDENIMEHSQNVTMLAHALAVIENKLYDGTLNIEKVVLYALYHETGEVMTGDIPTPIKYFNKGIHGAYKELETLACEKMVNMLPEEMRDEMSPYILADETSAEYQKLKKQVIAAQKLYREAADKYNAVKAAKDDARKELENKLAEIAKDISEETMVKYKSKRKEKIFPIVFRFNENSNGCPSCGMDLPIADVNKLKGGGMIECDSCYRVIYKE